MTINGIYFLLLGMFLLLDDGCTFRNDEIIAPPNTNAAIEIYYPVTNSEIQQGNTEVEYSITTPYSLKFIEIYIDDKFVRNYPPNSDGTQPKIFIDLDTSFIAKTISYFLIYYDLNGTSLKSELLSNIEVIESHTLPTIPFDVKLLNIIPSIVNISWKDSSQQVDSFQVWRKVNFSGAFKNYLVMPSPAFNVNDENISPDSIYFYKIKAINNFGESDFSREVNSADVYYSGNFYPPSNLTATASGAHVIELNWSDNSDDETYFVIERKSDFSDFTAADVVPKNSTSYKDSMNGLVPGAFYTYRIKSFSTTDSAWSNESRVETFLYDIPAPQNLTADYSTLLNIVVLIWSDTDPDNSLFEIERKEQSDDQFVKIASVSGAINFFSDSEILKNLIYNYRVRSSDGTVYSGYSNTAIVNTGL